MCCLLAHIDGAASLSLHKGNSAERCRTDAVQILGDKDAGLQSTERKEVNMGAKEGKKENGRNEEEIRERKQDETSEGWKRKN